MLKIGAEKIVIKGERFIRVTSIKGLMSDDILPMEYTSGFPHVTGIKNKCLQIVYKDYNGAYPSNYCLKVGEVYKEKDFEKQIILVKESGERLTEARKAEKELRKVWNGSIEIVI